jgi:hypothetical protein
MLRRYVVRKGRNPYMEGGQRPFRAMAARNNDLFIPDL